MNGLFAAAAVALVVFRLAADAHRQQRDRPEHFFGRQKSGNYPVPNLGRIQTTVRRAIIQPALLQRTDETKTTGSSC